MSTRHWMIGAASVAVLGVAQTAFAQNAKNTSAPAATDANGSSLNEIIVTARRRDESLQ